MTCRRQYRVGLFHFCSPLKTDKVICYSLQDNICCLSICLGQKCQDDIRDCNPLRQNMQHGLPKMESDPCLKLLITVSFGAQKSTETSYLAHWPYPVSSMSFTHNSLCVYLWLKSSYDSWRVWNGGWYSEATLRVKIIYMYSIFCVEELVLVLSIYPEWHCRFFFQNIGHNRKFFFCS